ncbi:ATP-binding protein [Amycolatopsis tucumanensis]|uniref:ATP-binding protein n=1 Tax=Amycolatopsis tucumanensis TaxID=401106 RepID=UPI001F02F306|nr:LuxR C-terminal-related transcriptional regulator [Amycolatopsis tucumanensis]MCF6423683.1 LuxR C-terminal-related transcriptional regulator [Amycolatopsis tucumanensis]
MIAARCAGLRFCASVKLGEVGVPGGHAFGDLTSFVGRDELVSSLVQRLRDGQRLLTLTGPGGVGKTRLGTVLARRLDDGDFDAVAIVRLADLELGGRNADDLKDAIVGMVIEALGVIDHQARRQPTEVLVEHLRHRRTLAVLDNVDHLLDPVADVVTELLDEAPRLQVTATSRQHLGVFGEHVQQVPPVGVPDAHDNLESALGTEAVILLQDRTRAAGRTLTPGDDWTSIIDLVRWSGGLPLVLELISAQLGGGMRPQVILERLDGGRLLRNFARRIPPHHRSLTQALDVSWDLCEPGQRRLWARLSVFSGGFDLDAAEEVCSGDELIATEEVMDLLSALVRHSLLASSPEGRFRQLQPLREYGLRRLREYGEEKDVRSRHAAWLLKLTESAAEKWLGPDEPRWLHRAHHELANVRSAVSWCRTPERAEVGLRIVTNLLRARVPFIFAFQSTAAGLMDDLLAVAPPGPSRVRLDALVMLGWTRIVLGDLERNERHRAECHELARELGMADSPQVLFLEGTYWLFSRGDRRGLDLLARARDGFRQAGAAGDAHMALLMLALGAGLLGPSDVADAATEECLAEARAHEAEWAITWGMWTLGLPARTEPLDVLAECLPRQLELGDKWGSTWCVEFAAWQRAAAGQPGEAEAAARLMGACRGLQERNGVALVGLIPFDRQRKQAADRIIATIGPRAFQAAYDDGAKLSTDEVYELVLAPQDRVTTDGEKLALADLTPARQKVALLVAQGLSNKEIADRTHTSHRTVETHLTYLYRVLGMNRTELAVWAAEQIR